MMSASIRLGVVLVTCVVIGLAIVAPYMTLAQEEEPSKDQPEVQNADAQLKAALENVGVSSPSEVAENETADAERSGFVNWVTKPFSNGEDTTEASLDDATVDEDEPVIAAPTAEVPSIAEDDITTTNDDTVEDARAQESSVPASSSAHQYPTLDELLQRAKQGTISQDEILLSRLTKRESIAEAMKRTLDIAAGVASHGEAAIQLLENDDLETVITTLITQQNDAVVAATIAGTPAPSLVESTIAPHSPIDEEQDPRFIDHTPVYARKQNGIVEVGMRHPTSGEIAVLFVDEAWHVGDDIVVLKRVLNQPSGSMIVFELNGERIHVPF